MRSNRTRYSTFLRSFGALMIGGGVLAALFLGLAVIEGLDDYASIVFYGLTAVLIFLSGVGLWRARKWGVVLFILASASTRIESLLEHQTRSEWVEDGVIAAAMILAYGILWKAVADEASRRNPPDADSTPDRSDSSRRT